MSVEEYLAREQDSPTGHEYLGGVLYAMAGGRNVHNRIASNALTKLEARLAGGPCQVFNSHTRIRVPLATQTRSYYPAASVICRLNLPHETFQYRRVKFVPEPADDADS